MVITRVTAVGWIAVAVMLLTSGCGGSSEPTGPSELSATGRWVGTAPEGMIVELNPMGNCSSEFDLELNLTSSSTGGVTGTATTRLRKTTPGASCSDVLGQVNTYGLFNGKVGLATISFDLGSTSAYRFSGTFTATRMTGTFVITEFPESGRFAVNRQ